MSHHQKDPKSLSEAIDKLESKTHSSHMTSSELKEILEKEIKAIKSTLSEMKPEFEELKEKAFDEVKKAKEEVKKAKNEVEKSIHEHPWWAIGIVGFIAFFLGFLFGWKKRD